MDMNPRTQGMVHPEQKPVEFFLGNFDPKFAEEQLQWKTKRIGGISLKENGTPYPSTIQSAYRPVPVFVLRMEMIEYHNKLYGK